MRLNQPVQTVRDKANFASLPDYIRFCLGFLDFVRDGLQAVIVSQNEPDYRLFCDDLRTLVNSLPEIKTES